jgi:hypothetical protein
VENGSGAQQRRRRESSYYQLMRFLCLLLAGCTSSGSMMGTAGPGVVELLSVAGPGEGVTASARAQFPDSFTSDLGCINPRTVGPCVIVDCPDGMVAPTTTHSDLGPVTIAVNNQAVVTMKFSGNDYAAATGLTPPLWKAGDDVHFSVAGDEAHVSAPSAVTLTAPDLRGGFSADFSMDLPLTWSGGTLGATVILHLGKYATCELASESGSGTIPAGALATVPSTGTPVYGYTSRPLTGQVGLQPLTFRPTTDLYGPDGMELTGSLIPK